MPKITVYPRFQAVSSTANIINELKNNSNGVCRGVATLLLPTHLQFQSILLRGHNQQGYMSSGAYKDAHFRKRALKPVQYIYEQPGEMRAMTINRLIRGYQCLRIAAVPAIFPAVVRFRT